MPKKLKIEAFLQIWEELIMKFPAQIYQISANYQTCVVTVKLRGINREIRDSLILRRFCPMGGVQVGFFKPRRLNPEQRALPKKDRPLYKVWVTIHLSKDSYRGFFPLVINSDSDCTLEEFETWITRAKIVLNTGAERTSS